MSPRLRDLKDDAHHIADPTDGSRTLCGQARHRVYNVQPFDQGTIDEGSACWTCWDRARQIRRTLTAWLP